MDANDKYLLGMLWKFGTLKPGTGQFAFDTYDKLEQLEYIRKVLAPDKQIRTYVRKDSNNGKDKITYRLRCTNDDWADKVKAYKGIKADKIADEHFIRGFLEVKSAVVKSGATKQFNICGTSDELEIVSRILSETFGIKRAPIYKANNLRGSIVYGVKDTEKFAMHYAKQNSKFWNGIMDKMKEK